MQKEKIIKFLSYDKAFGILTRPALDIEIEKIIIFDCCLIDFNNLRKLNHLIGYNKVNEIIFNIFNIFKNKEDCIIGRWFSGDECLIIGKNIEAKIALLENIAKDNGMTFKIKYYKKIKSLEELEKMIGSYQNIGFEKHSYISANQKVEKSNIIPSTKVGGF